MTLKIAFPFWLSIPNFNHFESLMNTFHAYVTSCHLKAYVVFQLFKHHSFDISICFMLINWHSEPFHEVPFLAISKSTFLPKCQIATGSPVCIWISLTQECVMTRCFGNVYCPYLRAYASDFKLFRVRLTRFQTPQIWSFIILCIWLVVHNSGKPCSTNHIFDPFDPKEEILFTLCSRGQTLHMLQFWDHDESTWSVC